MAENKLTSQQYWETYYKAKHTDKNHIVNVCSFYDVYWNKLISKTNDAELIEIGGYPGRYLAYLASKYSVKPTCLDYNSNISQIKDSFKTMAVENYEIIQADFTKHQPEKLYDYVISNGFIEHFENYDTILDKHINYLDSKGKLLVMIPNMRGYIKIYKLLVDKKNLDIHNLNSMSLKVFRDFAKRNHLKINHLSYYGNFPHNVHQNLNFFQEVIFKSHQIFFKKFANSIVNKYPSKYFSSGIIGIFEKQD